MTAGPETPFIGQTLTDRLIEEGIDPCIGSVGDAYDNSLAKSQIGH